MIITQIKLGQKWLNRSGDTATVVEFLFFNDTKDLILCPYKVLIPGTGRHYYVSPEGVYKVVTAFAPKVDSPEDLVTLVEDAPEGQLTETAPLGDSEQFSVEKIKQSGK